MVVKLEKYFFLVEIDYLIRTKKKGVLGVPKILEK